jgi:lipid-binding SYLF domain-containing protein
MHPLFPIRNRSLSYIAVRGAFMRRFLLLRATTLILAIAVPASANLEEKVADRLWDSSEIIRRLLFAPDHDIPTGLLRKAECVAVIPQTKKLAVVFGARYGRGAVSCRGTEGDGAWGAPSMISLAGGSFGWQLGVQSTDLVMVFMTAGSVWHLLRDRVIVGAEAAAAAGPLGRAASAETTVSLRAEILTYAQSRGLFAGLSLNGAVLRPDDDANKVLYKRSVSAHDLLLSKIAVPAAAQKFVDMLASAMR